MKEIQARQSSATEVIIVTAICFGLFIYWSLQAVAAGFPSGAGFSDSYLINIALTECVLTFLAMMVLRWQAYPLKSLLAAPNWRDSGTGCLLLVVAYLAWAFVCQFFNAGHYMREPMEKMALQSHPTMTGVLLMSIINGWYEETFLLAYLMTAVDKLGASTAIGISVLVRLLYHLYQGPVGAVSILVFGVIFTAYYWRSRKLWPVVFAHMLADFIGLSAQI